MFDFLTLMWVIIIIAIHIKCTKMRITGSVAKTSE